MIENKDITYLENNFLLNLSEIETYMLQNNVQSLRSTLKSFIWSHDFVCRLCAQVIHNML